MIVCVRDMTKQLRGGIHKQITEWRVGGEEKVTFLDEGGEEGGE
jgi:hypothetical protein